MWRSHARDRLSRDECRDFDEAVQELKFRVMVDKVATGSVAIDETMREQINGHTVREVLVLGYRSLFDRLTAQKKQMEDVIYENSRMHARPGDTESAAYLRDKLQSQADQVTAVSAKLAHAEEKLQLYLAPATK